MSEFLHASARRASPERAIFVGREELLECVQNWLDEEDSATHLLFVTGMGGIGKTAALQRIEQLAIDQGRSAVWIDGRACGHSPSAFLEYVSAVRDSNWTQLEPHGRFHAPDVLCIDNFEDLHPISGWLRHEFIPSLFDRRCLIVTASRQEPPIAWRSDAVWRERWSSFYLDVLSPEEAEAVLRLHGVAEHPQASALLKSAKGHPLALALGSDALARRVDGGTMDPWELPHELSAYILRECATPEAHPFLDALAVLPEGDQERLAAVADEPLPADVFHELARLSFVQRGPRGLSLHDVARGLLSSDLRWRAPHRFATLRRRSARVIQARMTTAPPRERRLLAAQLLEVCSDVSSVDSAVSAGMSYVDGITSDDRADLHRLVDRSVDRGYEMWPRKRYHDALDMIIQKSPESIRVARDAKARPIAFNIQLWLTKDSMDFLDYYVPGLLTFLSEADRAALSKMDASSADTTLCITIGLETSVSPFPSGEAIDHLVRDAWASLSDRGRSLILLEGDAWREIYQQLGCAIHLLPGPLANSGVFFADLDLRRVEFSQFAFSLLDRLDATATEPPLPSLAAAPASTGLRPPQVDQPTVEEMRSALTAVHDIGALNRSPLTLRLGIDGAILQERLLTLLTQDPPPPPLDVKSQRLLHASYMAPPGNRSDVAAHFYLSRSSYFRRLKDALQLAATALARG